MNGHTLLKTLIFSPILIYSANFGIGIGTGIHSISIGDATGDSHQLIADRTTSLSDDHSTLHDFLVSSPGNVKNISYSVPTTNLSAFVNIPNLNLKITGSINIAKKDELAVYFGYNEDQTALSLWLIDNDPLGYSKTSNNASLENTETTFSSPKVLDTSSVRASSEGIIYSQVVGSELQFTGSGADRLTGSIIVKPQPGERVLTVSPNDNANILIEYTADTETTSLSLGAGLLMTSDKMTFEFNGDIPYNTKFNTNSTVFEGQHDVLHTKRIFVHDNHRIWYGLTTSSTSKLSDRIQLNTSLSYFTREFKKDAPLFVEKSYASLMGGSISLMITSTPYDESNYDLDSEPNEAPALPEKGKRKRNPGLFDRFMR